MPTTLKQLEDEERGKTVLRVEGSLTKADAVILEKVALEILEKTNKPLSIDLSDLHFLDSESAPILKNLENCEKIEIEGVWVFLQRVLEESERK